MLSCSDVAFSHFVVDALLYPHHTTIPNTGKDPEVICASSEYKELKWIAGEFYWMESVQTYKEGGWDYLAELRKFVEGGMVGDAFINAVSGIVNRGEALIVESLSLSPALLDIILFC